jgi:hypothetical protein
MNLLPPKESAALADRLNMLLNKLEAEIAAANLKTPYAALVAYRLAWLLERRIDPKHLKVFAQMLRDNRAIAQFDDEVPE